jgi:type III pantothenate kinase
MFLAVSINNFEIDFFLVDNNAKVVSTFSVSSREAKTVDQYISEIKGSFEVLEVNKKDIIYAGICSSIPKLESIVSEFINKYLNIEPLLMNNSNIPLDLSLMDGNSEIPTSILVDMFSGLQYHQNVICVNFGSFISFGVAIDKKFAGYAIYPSIEMCSTIIHEKTFIFPDIMTKPTNSFIGQNKYDAMSVGLFNGCLGACDRIILGMKDSFPRKDIKVIATGKNAEIFTRYSSQINEYNNLLQINGIISIVKRILTQI